MIQQTSLESWGKLQNSLGRRQREVLTVLQERPASNRELAELLFLPINSVTGRVKELRSLGYVKLRAVKYDAVTDRRVNEWEARR